MSDSNQASIAARFGVSKAAVTYWVQEGMPADSVDAAEAWLRVHRPRIVTNPLDHSIQTAKVTDEGPRGAFARAREVEKAAHKQAMADVTASNIQAHAKAVSSAQDAAEAVAKWEVAAGNLVSVEEVKTAWVRFFALLRAEMDGMPTRLSERIGGNCEPALRAWRDRTLERLGRSQPFGCEEPEDISNET